MFDILDRENREATFLKLVKDGSRIELRVFSAKGDRKYGGLLMRFLPDGTYSRVRSVNEYLGVKRDSSGKIQEVD